MSLLNAWIHPSEAMSEAILAVDTEAARNTGERFAASKVMAVPHLGCAIAVRGQAAILQAVHMRASGAGFDSFDELAAVMPAMVRGIIETMPARLLVSAPLTGSGNIVALVGWSDEQRAMVGMQFVQREADQPFRAEAFTTLLAPWPPELQHLPATAQAVGEIAAAQVDWMRAEFPVAQCGGQLVLCRVTRAGIELVRRPLGARMEMAA